MDEEKLLSAIGEASVEFWQVAEDRGWHVKPRDIPTDCALFHAEVSELFEGYRNHNPPDQHCPEFSSIEIEAADIFIRLLEAAARHGWQLGRAILAKNAYNKTRAYRHGGKVT